MNKKEIIKNISTESGLKENQVKDILEAFENNIKNHIVGEERESLINYTDEEKELKEDKTLVEVSVIYVDCERNDRVDIKAGGPMFLGYTFLVETKEVKVMKDFIKEKLEENNQPLLYMYDEKLEKKRQRKETWIRKEIEGCIVKSYEPKAKGKTITYPKFAQFKIKG